MGYGSELGIVILGLHPINAGDLGGGLSRIRNREEGERDEASTCMRFIAHSTPHMEGRERERARGGS